MTHRFGLSCFAACAALLLLTVAGAHALSVEIVYPFPGGTFDAGTASGAMAYIYDTGNHNYRVTWDFTDDNSRSQDSYSWPPDYQLDYIIVWTGHVFATKGPDWKVTVTVEEVNTHATAQASCDFSTVSLTLTTATLNRAPANADDSRKTIGIGEGVQCTLAVDPPGNYQLTWSKQGAPAWVDQTGLYGALGTPGTSTVTVSVGSSYPQATASAVFTIIAPDHLEYALQENEPNGTAKHPMPAPAGPPNVHMWCDSYFKLTVCPLTVSFKLAWVTEDVSAVTINWPNNTQTTAPGQKVATRPDQDNLIGDECWNMQADHTIDRLTGCQYDPYSYSHAASIYADVTQDYTRPAFDTAQHTYEFHTTGDNRGQARAREVGTGGRGADGGWMGPYQ